jgi:Ras-related protein Rab-1A
MSEQRSELQRYKSLILGDSNVGKSSVLLRYERDQFHSDYEMTIGVDFMYKELIVEGQRMNWRIWDTAGQEKYRSIVTSYLKGLDGIAFAFDLTNPSSFTSVSHWVHYFNSHASNPSIPRILIGNKADAVISRVIAFEEAQKLASSLNMIYFEVSALTGANIAEAFNYLARLILSNGGLSIPVKASTSTTLSLQPMKKKCCS